MLTKNQQTFNHSIFISILPLRIVALFIPLFGLFLSAMPAWALSTSGSGPGGVGTTDGNSSLVLWLKADAGVYTDAGCTSGNEAADTDDVNCWQDQSGNGNHVTQTGFPFSPSYHTDGPNDEPTLRLQQWEHLSGPAILDEGDDDFTMIAVWKSDIEGLQVVFEQNHDSLEAGRRAAMLLTDCGSTGGIGFSGQNNDGNCLAPYTANE
ncbi:hypothetical protein KFU94_24200 [Chloroflexi bacterium TSY]|nr:hypothetical protein [Chloroflexi bacterium TSY]